MIVNRLLAMSAWLHYALGTTVSQILAVFNFHLHFEISSGGWHRLEQRLRAMIEHAWENKEAQRLVKRLRRHEQELFTFVLETDVPFDNNHGERMIRITTIAVTKEL